MKIKDNFFVKYSLCFLLAYALVFLSISIKNETIGFSGLFIDGFTQHLLFFNDFITKIKDSLFLGASFPTYDFNLGLGGDIVASYGYYSLFDPFNIIAILLPASFIEGSFYLIIFIKLFLGGYFFALLAKKLGLKNDKIIIICSIFYSLCSSTIVSTMKHPIFTGAIMFLPLVILGIEKAIRKESKSLLVLSVFLTLMSQFYMAFYVVLSAELFLIFRLTADKTTFKEWLIKFIKINLFVLLGLGLGGIVLLTQAMALLSNGRGSGNELVMYPFEYYCGLIFSFFIPFSSMNYTMGLGNIIGVFVIGLFIGFYNKEKWLKRLIILELSFFTLSIFGFTLSLFTYANNRWSFVIMVPLLLAMATSLENYKEYSLKNKQTVIKGIILAIDIGACFGSLYLIKQFINVSTYIKLVIYMLDILVFIYFAKLLRKINLDKFKFKIKDLPMCLINVQICFMMVCTLVLSLKWNTRAYIFNDYYNNEFSSSRIEDDSLYRVSKNSYVLYQDHSSNDSVYGKYGSTSLYNSMNNGNIINMLRFLEVNNYNVTVGYNGLNNRYVLETLFGVKYFIDKSSDYNSVPYNFDYYNSYYSHIYTDLSSYSSSVDEQKETTTIYKNNNYMSLGYVYNSYLNINDLNNVTGLERQDAMLKSLILEEDTNYINENVYTSNNITSKQFTIKNKKGLEIDNNQINVKEDDAILTLEVENIVNSELYVRFEGLKKTTDDKYTITYKSSNAKYKETTYRKGSNFYLDNSTNLEHMGYYENKEKEEIIIKFSSKGRYNYESLEVFTYSMNNVNDLIDSLQENSLKDISLSNNVLKGTVTSEEKGMLLIALPYDTGFTAYVNGKETDIQRANVGFMAVKVNEGENTIVLKYKTKGLKTGLLISAISSGMFLLYIPCEIIHLRKKKIKVENN